MAAHLCRCVYSHSGMPCVCIGVSCTNEFCLYLSDYANTIPLLTSTCEPGYRRTRTLYRHSWIHSMTWSGMSSLKSHWDAVQLVSYGIRPIQRQAAVGASRGPANFSATTNTCLLLFARQRLSMASRTGMLAKACTSPFIHRYIPFTRSHVSNAFSVCICFIIHSPVK